MRVPCLIICRTRKRARRHKATFRHTRYEFGSILRFIEEVYNLPHIGTGATGYTDARANSLTDSFNFLQTPRPFTPFGSKYPASTFINEPESNEPVDEQ